MCVSLGLCEYVRRFTHLLSKYFLHHFHGLGSVWLVMQVEYIHLVHQLTIASLLLFDWLRAPTMQLWVGRPPDTLRGAYMEEWKQITSIISFKSSEVSRVRKQNDVEKLSVL